MGIIVENGGILTTVQDEGRFGYQAFGVSTSGAMDNHSFHIANILVGNDMGEGALEMTFIGPTLKFTSDNIIAVTGGDLTPMLDGNEFPMYRAVLVKEGQTLSFAGARNGCRGYIAFAGGLDIPIVMGSKSTLLRNHLGGVKGRKLEKSDEIGFVSAKTILPNMEARKVPASVYPKKEIVLRVVLGPPMNLTVWAVVSNGSRSNMSEMVISIQMVFPSDPSRCQRMESRSLCYRTDRAPEDMPR